MSIFITGKVLNKYQFSSHFLLIIQVSFMLSHGEHSILKIENKIRNVFASPFIIIVYFYIKQIVNIFLLSSLTFNILGSYFLPKQFYLMVILLKSFYIISYWHCHFFDPYLITDMISIFGKITIWLCMKLSLFIILLTFGITGLIH